MRDRPTPAELLSIARETVRGSLLDALPEDKRYEALMVANALAIAVRQIERGAGEKKELASLATLFGEAVAPHTAEGVHALLVSLNRRLAAGIRKGAFDPGTPKAQAAHGHLWRTTLARVAESNPKALPKNGG